MITSAQLRAARALLRITAADLAGLSGVGVSTIKRFELADGVPAANVRTLEALKLTIENQGVEFIGAPNDKPGVRLK